MGHIDSAAYSATHSIGTSDAVSRINEARVCISLYLI